MTTEIIVLTVVANIAFGMSIRSLIDEVRKLLALRRHHVRTTPVRCREQRMCRGPHTWADVKMPDGDSQKVCRGCGFISGTNFQLPVAAMVAWDEELEAREAEDKRFEEFLAAEDIYIREYFGAEIAGGLDEKKLQDCHAMGMSAGFRYQLWRQRRQKTAEPKGQV